MRSIITASAIERCKARKNISDDSNMRGSKLFGRGALGAKQVHGMAPDLSEERYRTLSCPDKRRSSLAKRDWQIQSVFSQSASDKAQHFRGARLLPQCMPGLAEQQGSEMLFLYHRTIFRLLSVTESR